MEQTLKKLAASVRLTYADGTAADALLGRDFILREEAGSPCLAIDLADNLSEDNRAFNCYNEAAFLMKHGGEMKQLRLTDPQILQGLLRASQHYKRPWMLEVTLDHTILRYIASLTVKDNISATFDISGALN